MMSTSSSGKFDMERIVHLDIKRFLLLVMEYFVMLGKTKAGPYSIEEMREKNLLRPEVMISAQGTGEWLKVKDMPELLVAS